MFGAEDFYFIELQNFKKTLLSLYQKRVKFSAERETERWKYITQTKGEWATLTSKIYDQAFLINSYAVDIARAVLVNIARAIPMVKLDGKPENGFGQFEFYGGPLGLSQLSPTAHLISDPFYKGQEAALEMESRPFYKIYGSSLRNSADLVNDYFFGNVSKNMTAAWNALSSSYVFMSWPINDEWVEALVRSQGSNLRVGPEALPLWPQVKNLIEASYDGKSIDSFLEKTKEQLIKVLDLTAMVIRVQQQIDDTEEQLKNFVTEYSSQFGDALNASDILRDLNLAAQGDMDAIKRLGLYEAPTEATVESAPLTDEAPVKIEAPKSKLPWIAAAAIGVFLATRN